MANLWVIITGLGTLVGNRAESPGSAHSVLLRPVIEPTMVPPENGKIIPLHQPSLRVRAEGPDIPIRTDIRLPWDIEPAALANGRSLLPLGRELEFPALRLKNDLEKLSVATRPIKMQFNGGSIVPIHVYRSFDLEKFSVDVELRLAGAHHISTALTIPKNREIANGILYQRSFSSGTPPLVYDGDDVYSPNLVPLNRVGELPVGDEELNYVLWISNTAAPSPDLKEDFDRDYYLLYDWLQDSTVVRYVPLIPKNVAPVTPPGQCMFGYARSES